VRHRFYRRWLVVLGMLAMLGALVSLPLTATYAVAMAGVHSSSMSASSDEMPCHKPAVPCAGCPQKVCPDMGNCLLKCFQPLFPPIGVFHVQGIVVTSLAVPSAYPACITSHVSPILRPPIV
jgi:hypothetical protein